MLSGVGDERIHCRHCFYMAGRREWRDSAAGGVGLRLIPGKALFFRRGRKLFAGKRRRRVWWFAPWSRESLISPLRGANFLQGRAVGGCGGLRLTPGKALFFRQGAQTFCRDKAPAAVWVCASYPGKPYSSVERRKPFAGKSRRWRCGFAPHSRESFISPLRGANLLPGKAPGGYVGLRLIPRKALFHH